MYFFYRNVWKVNILIAILIYVLIFSVSGCLILNSGQTLQFFSNKRLKSTKNSELISIQFKIVGKMFDYLEL